MRTSRPNLVWLRAIVALLLAAWLCGARPARAGMIQRQSVSDYFAALNRQDFTTVLRKTSGQARALTAGLIDELRQQAAKHGIHLDLATRSVHIDATPEGPVRVRFDIDVFTRFAWVRKVVRTIRGQATFSVDAAGQIVNISGDLGK
jgi:hypothetical protein